MFTDTHAHLTSPELLPEIDAIIARASEVKVSRLINICTDLASLESGLALAERYPHIGNTAATTPHDVAQEGESFFPHVAAAAKKGALVAIGETGLDYHYFHSSLEEQQRFLLRYITLACEVELPLIFHCREAFNDLFALADQHYLGKPAVLHCFTGSLAEAKGVLDRGWYLSLSGIITFKHSLNLRAIAQYVPLDRLFLETDAPYLAPQSQRGKRCEPAFLPETAAAIAAIKNIAIEELAAITTANAVRFFGCVNT